MTSIKLSRRQIHQLYELAVKLDDVEDFTVISDNSNGIGPAIRVEFDLFPVGITSTDITDVTKW